MGENAAMIDIRNVSFTYASCSTPGISDVNVTIPSGDFVLITGATGCGKSTLLKTLNGLIPHESGGLFTGHVVVDGHNVRDFSVAELSSLVGMMFQSPDDQIFSATPADEVAFILENMGMSTREIEKNIGPGWFGWYGKPQHSFFIRRAKAAVGVGVGIGGPTSNPGA